MSARARPSVLDDAAIVRRSRGDEAALLIRQMIFAGELRPGDRVPQDEVARALRISRIPVREALIALEREGWVTIELHRGAFVNTLDANSVRDNYELFGVVYGLAARRAVRRSGKEFVDTLDGLVKAMRATDDPAEMRRLSIRFHGTIVEAARSPRVNVVLRAMSALVPGEFFAVVPDAAAIERRGFAAIAKSLRKGDGDAAAAEYTRMMTRVGEKVVAVFRDRGLVD